MPRMEVTHYRGPRLSGGGAGAGTGAGAGAGKRKREDSEVGRGSAAGGGLGGGSSSSYRGGIFGPGGIGFAFDDDSSEGEDDESESGYASRADFDAAMELYNRQNAEPGLGGSHIANVAWQRRPVRGNHKKDCTDCGCSFHYGMDYVQEMANGPWGAEKLCVSCFGRKLRKAVGTDRAKVEAKLAPLRAAQPRGIETGYFAQAYGRIRR